MKTNKRIIEKRKIKKNKNPEKIEKNLKNK